MKALLVLGLIVAACLLAPAYAQLVSGADPFRIDPLGVVHGVPVLAEAADGLGTLPIGPGWRGAYLLGGDALGRDVAARLLYAGRTSLLLAGAATLLCLALGLVAGIAAGALGGWADATISAGLELIWAFPVLLLAIALSLSLTRGDPGRGVFVPVLILGIAYAPYVARPVRAALRALADVAFIEAARATGGSPWHILRRHAVPQLVPLLLGLVPVIAATMLLTEATLSVLGLGVQAPGASWGTMIADGQALLHQRPLVAIAPGVAVAATVLALNALGSAPVRLPSAHVLGAVLGRLLRGVAVLTGISVLVFLLFFTTPGADPAARLAGRGAAPEIIARVRAEYGFDRPLPVQCEVDVAPGGYRDLPSFVNRGQAVVPAVLAAAPVTIGLVALAAALWLGLGLVIGVVSARMARGRVVVAAGLLGVSIPAFWLAELVAAASQGPWHAGVFAWVPPLGEPPEGLLGWLRTLLLPAATLAVLYAGIYGRVLHTGIAAGLRADYARTARAKGLGETRVALRHALPNAVVPALALLGLDLGALLGGGTVLIELAFGLHGIGRLTYDALTGLDLAMVMACVLYGAAFVVAANVAVDAAMLMATPGAPPPSR